MSDHTQITGGTLAYLATPYTDYPRGVDNAFWDACTIAGDLLFTGIKVFCPIAHGHAVEMHSDIRRNDMSIWGPLNARMMAACDVLIVAHLEGWADSKGIAEEVRAFEAAGKPIFDLDPATMAMTRRKREAA